MNKEEIERVIDNKVAGMKISLLCIMSFLTGKYPDFIEITERMVKKIEKDFGGDETKH